LQIAIGIGQEIGAFRDLGEVPEFMPANRMAR